MIPANLLKMTTGEHVELKFAYHFFSSKFFQEALKTIIKATAQPAFGITDFKTLPFPLAPLNEQTRIVAEIEKQFSRLDEAVANLKRVKANLKRYKAAVLKAAVEGKLTEEWRKKHPDVEPADKLLERILAERRKAAGKGKYKEAVGPDTSGLPELPAGWVWVSWDVILRAEKASFRRGPFGGSLKKSIFIPSSDYKVYEQYCPINDDPKFARYFITKEKYEEMKSFSVTAGDFLISCSGSLGRITQIPLDYDPGVINQALLRVRIDKALMGDEYFLRLFRSPYFQKQIIDNTQGAAMVNVKGVDDLKAIPLPLPPLAEQKVIVEMLEQTLSLAIQIEKQIEIDLRRADRLRQSILKQAFSGQLVPQDPNDEPASVLLERIRANASVGADRVRSERVIRKVGASVAPLRKPRPQTEPANIASNKFACLDDITAAILSRMQPRREYARSELADPLGLSAGRWNAAIQDLKRVGKVRQVGEKRGARYLKLK